MSDATLTERWLAGERRSGRVLVGRHFDRVRAILAKHGVQRQAAEVFDRVSRTLPELEHQPQRYPSFEALVDARLAELLAKVRAMATGRTGPLADTVVLDRRGDE